MAVALADGAYQWRAREVDALGAATEWTEFGAVAGGADFTVQIARLVGHGGGGGGCGSFGLDILWPLALLSLLRRRRARR